MAIQFARARYVSRSSGGNAVRSSAYNARAAITAERTGELFHFRQRGTPEHHEVLLPEGADDRLRDCGALWNAAEAAERRRDAQVAREVVLALPADRELSTEDRVELARSFADRHFVTKGLAVQLDVHAPHEAGEGEENERANWHAHLLISTRRVEGDGFAAKKARDLDPEVRRGAGGRAVVAEGEAWGALWREHQDRYFQEHGLGVRVDPVATHAGEHIGPVRMRRAGSAAVERAEVLRCANQEAARDPEQVLAALTRNNATFTERDLDRHLSKHLGEGAEAERERAAVKAAVLGHGNTLPLFERDTGEAVGRFTTGTVRGQEEAALGDAEAVAGARHHRGVGRAAAAMATGQRTLRPDQLAAFEHAVGPGGLKVIEGRAGTGKSYTVQAVREAHERGGMRVVGLAPTNAVAQDLRADGFAEAGTVHAALFALKNGRTAWDKRTVVVADEAAMLDSRVAGELLAEAKASGAKVILAGDDRQLASIERGGLFTELVQRHGSAAITEVTRQRVGWQREAARDLAEGRFGAAVAAFDRHGAVTWSTDADAARTALVARWRADTAAEPGASRFVFAYTNREVDALNAELRGVRRERGELGGADVVLETKHGAAGFAVGDRVQFTDTSKRAGIYNGNVGRITGIHAGTGRVTAVLDGGREVSWRADEFGGFRHGYAGTIYKGQGRTLDHTYLLHGEHWRSASSYVALTRQRESARVFVSREVAQDAKQLARQMGRGEVRAASVAWATAAERRVEVEVAPREATAKATIGREVQAAEAGWARSRPAMAVSPGAPAPSAVAGQGVPGSQDVASHGWLMPPHVSRDGRDSLGRGTDAESVRRAVAADPLVRRERQALVVQIGAAYRDPDAATARLDALLAREGWTSTAARLQAEPGQLGELRGKVGLFAGAKAKEERVRAEMAAGGVPGTLERIGTAENKAERAYRAGVSNDIRNPARGDTKNPATSVMLMPRPEPVRCWT